MKPTTASHNFSSQLVADPAAKAVVIVGAGPVGIRCAQELLQRGCPYPIVIYGDEPDLPYNRVLLSALLTGELQTQAIGNPLALLATQRRPVLLQTGCAVTTIDRVARTVTDAEGRTQAYAKLILATGAQPFIPAITGTTLSNVFTYWTLRDAKHLRQRRQQPHRIVVLGGGILALEVACAMKHAANEVTVVEQASRLMPKQLDAHASYLLGEHLQALGIKIILGDSVTELLGERTVVGARLQAGRLLACDTMIIATGVRANTHLARLAQLGVNRGIEVNDRMQTCDDHIYAVGDCAEYLGQSAGLVKPGYEQAAVAAQCILGRAAVYRGAHVPMRLKTVGLPVFAVGVVVP